MNLIVLGGAAACPNPGQGSAGYLIRNEETTILVDCGAGIVQELRKHISLDELSAIIVSHVHSDHIIDLVPLRYGLKYIPELAQRTVPTFLPPGGIDFTEQLGQLFAMGSEQQESFFSGTLDRREYDPSAPLSIGSITVTFLQTQHPVDCWAMRFTSGDTSVTYLADTAPHPGLVEFAQESDILICESTYVTTPRGFQEGERPHLDATEAGTIGREAGVRKLVLTHLWGEFGISNYRAAGAEAFGASVYTAEPGLFVSTDQDQDASQ